MPSTMILDTLQQIRRKVKLMSVLFGVGVVVASAVGLMLVTFLFDYLLRLPPWPRLVFITLALAGLGYSAWHWLIRAAIARLTISDIAGRLEHAFPQFDDRLRSTVDFSGDKEIGGSAVMKERTVAKAAQMASEVNLNSGVLVRPVFFSLAGGIAAVALLVGLALINRDLTSRALARLFNPFTQVQYATSVEIGNIDGWPARDRVAAGQHLDLRMKLKKGSPSKVIVHYQYDNGSTQEQRMTRSDDGTYAVSLDARGSAMKVWVEAGDDETARRLITVVPPLAISHVDCIVTPPAYTGQIAAPPVELGQMPATLVVGSAVDIRIAFNKPLADGNDSIRLESVRPETKVPAIQWSRMNEQTAVAHFMATESLRFRVKATDRDTFSNPGLEEYEVIVRPDQLPSVMIESPRKNEDRTPNAFVPLTLMADDDFGIAELKLIVNRFGAKPATQPDGVAASTTQPARSGDPLAADWVIDLPTDPENLVPGDNNGERKRFKLADWQWELSKILDKEGKPALKAGDVIEYYVMVRDNYNLNGAVHPYVPSGRLKITIISQEQLDLQVTDAMRLNSEQIRVIQQTQNRNLEETKNLREDLQKRPLDNADKKALSHLIDQQTGAASRTKQVAMDLAGLEKRLKENQSSNKALADTASSVRDRLNNTADQPMAQAAQKLSTVNQPTDNKNTSQQNDPTQKNGDPKAGDPSAQKNGDPKSGDPKTGDPKSGDPKNQTANADPKNSDPKNSDPKNGDPKNGDPKSGDPKNGDPKSGDPKSQTANADPKSGDPKSGDPKSGDPKAGDPKAGDPKSGDPKAGDPKSQTASGDPKSGDPKSGDPKSGDPKSGDPKSGDPKSGSPKSGDPKSGSQSAQKGGDPKSPEEAKKDLSASEEKQAEASKELDKALDRLGDFGALAALKKDVEKALQEQQDLYKKLADFSKQHLGEDPKAMKEDDKKKLDDIAKAQAKAAENTQKLQANLDKAAAKQEKADPASSQAMKQAAAQAKDQQGSSNQQQASQSAQQNQQASAQSKQKQAELGLQMMLNTLREAERRKTEALVKALTELKQKIELLVKRQAGHNIDNIVLIDQKDLITIDAMKQLMIKAGREKALDPATEMSHLIPSQEQTERNTRSYAGEAEKLPKDGAILAANLSKAAGHMERGIGLLRDDEKLKAYNPSQVEALAALEQALEKVRAMEEEAKADQQEANNDTLRQEYEKFLARQKAINPETIRIDATARDADGNLNREEGIKVKQNADIQGKLSEDVKAMDTKLVDFGATVYLWTNKDVYTSMQQIRDELVKPEPGKATQAEQVRVTEELEAMIRNLAIKPPRKSPFDQKGGGGGGGGGKPPKPQLPPEAELRLLRELQVAINKSTTAQAGLPNKDKNKLTQLSVRQGELRGIFGELLKKASQGKLTINDKEPNANDQLPEKSSPQDVTDQELKDALLQDAPADDDVAGLVKLNGDRMARSRQRLAKLDPGQTTQEIQKRIEMDLTKLAEASRAQQGQQGQPKPGQGHKPQPGQPEGPANQGPPGQGKPKPNKGNTPASNSQMSGPAGTDAPTKDIRETARNWGNLTQRQRDAIIDSQNDDIVERYRKLTEEYYRTLATKATEQK